jgi:signal transduction histidine kinase
VVSRLLRRVATIRARTTIAACVVVALALAVSAILVLAVLRRSLVDNVDRATQARAEDVAASVQQRSLPTTPLAPGEEDTIVQVVTPSGDVENASANFTHRGPITDAHPRGARPERRTMRGLPDPHDNTEFRVVALRTPGPEGERIVYVAASLEPVEESVDAVRDILVLGLPLLLVVVGVTTWVVVGRALRPVEAIRAQVADFSSRDLSRRVPEPNIDDEVGRLATTMNVMLDRLQRFAERQRAFVADSSHELQSPIASSRAELEVAVGHPSTTDWPATAADLLEDNQRMEHLVRDLLFLARADDTGLEAPQAPVDLDDVVRTEVERIRGRARADIVASPVSAVEVSGSADQLGRVVRNLLENADRHAESRVTVELHSSDDTAVIVVADDGAGVPAADQDRIFERFTRLDDSRSRATGGAGLGLAIAKEIVEAHHGRILVEPGSNGARFVVRLPVHV